MHILLLKLYPALTLLLLVSRDVIPALQILPDATSVVIHVSEFAAVGEGEEGEHAAGH